MTTTRGWGNFPTPQIGLRAGEVTDSSLSFELAPSDASEAVYLVVKDGDPLPDTDHLFASGRKADPTTKKTYTESGLASGTKYHVLAAAANDGGRSEVARVEMTTSQTPVPRPAVTLAAGEATVSSLRFTLTPADADKAAFACYPKGAPEPEAGELLRSGTPADATAAKPYTVEDLDPNTTYIIAAAASSGEAISEVARIEMTTLGNNPSLELSLVEATSSAIRFAITPRRADRAAYMYYKAGEAAPDAERILAEGTAADADQYAAYLLEGLNSSTGYVIAAAAANGAELSEVATLEATTAAPEPPALGDFYYDDGTWSSAANDPLPDKTCIGIVVYAGRCTYEAVDDCVYKLKDGTTPLEEVHGYVLALRNASDKTVAWGSWGKDGYSGAGASYDRTDFRGYSNTQSIRNKAIEKAGGLSDDADDNYPATYYATDVYEQQVPAPASSTGWFLPSAYQLLYLFSHVETLQESFDKLGEQADFFYVRDAEYWSSTECQKENGCLYWAYYVSLDPNQITPGFSSNFRKSSDWFQVRSMLVF